MKMKKILLALGVICMMGSLVACGNKTSKMEQQDETTQVMDVTDSNEATTNTDKSTSKETSTTTSNKKTEPSGVYYYHVGNDNTLELTFEDGKVVLTENGSAPENLTYTISDDNNIVYTDEDGSEHKGIYNPDLDYVTLNSENFYADLNMAKNPPKEENKVKSNTQDTAWLYKQYVGYSDEYGLMMYLQDGKNIYIARGYENGVGGNEISSFKISCDGNKITYTEEDGTTHYGEKSYDENGKIIITYENYTFYEEYPMSGDYITGVYQSESEEFDLKYIFKDKIEDDGTVNHIVEIVNKGEVAGYDFYCINGNQIVYKEYSAGDFGSYQMFGGVYDAEAKTITYNGIKFNWIADAE